RVPRGACRASSLEDLGNGDRLHPGIPPTAPHLLPVSAHERVRRCRVGRAEPATGGGREKPSGGVHARDPASSGRRRRARPPGRPLGPSAEVDQDTGVAKLGTYSGGGRPTIGIAWAHARHRFWASKFQDWIVNP